MVRLLARVLRPTVLSWTSARPSTGSQEVSVLSPQALENYQEDKLVVNAWPWLELPGSRLLQRSMHRGRKSSTQSRATTNSGQHKVRYLGLSGLGCGASSAARRRVSRAAVRACRRQWPSQAQSAPASATAPVPVCDSTDPQKLKDGNNRTDYNGFEICREWSCSHDKCSDPCPRQQSHVCIRCPQLHRLASCPAQSRSCYKGQKQLEVTWW